MKLTVLLSAAALALAPVAAFAQDNSNNGRGDGAKGVGPASENGDTTLGNTKNPAAMGRSAAPDAGISSMGSHSSTSTEGAGTSENGGAGGR